VYLRAFCIENQGAISKDQAIWYDLMSRFYADLSRSKWPVHDISILESKENSSGSTKQTQQFRHTPFQAANGQILFKKKTCQFDNELFRFDDKASPFAIETEQLNNKVVS
jgi:hypothetical protein